MALLVVVGGTGTVHSVYKPVPPPKPFSGNNNNNNTTEDQDTTQQQQQQHNNINNTTTSLRDQLATITGGVTGSGGTTSNNNNNNGPPPLLSHILVTDQGHFHTHSTKFPTSGVGGGSNLSGGGVGVLEEREQLVASERHLRFLDGIDNPALLDDTPMPSYRAQGGVTHTQPSHIPPEGTLAGVLPNSAQPRPYESPFLPRLPFRNPSHQQQQQQQSSQLHHTPSSQSYHSTSQHHPAPGSQHLPPPSSQSHQGTNPQPYSSSSASQQPSLTRETWMRSSQGQYAGLVEIHPPQGHLYMNGHTPHSHHGLPNPHLPNGSTHSHSSPHHDGPHTHHHTHMNGHQEPSVGQGNRSTVTAPDDNAANDCQERRDDLRKDDKWGSLTRGLAARKYQNLKEKLSNKFSRGDKSEERPSDIKNINSQGTNTQLNGNTQQQQQHQEGGVVDQGPGGGENGRVNKLNTSFRRAVQQTPGQHQQSTMETSLTHDHTHTNGLPPHYPRSPDQYRPKQPLPVPQSHQAGPPSPRLGQSQQKQQQQDPFGHGLGNRRSGSYHHLTQVRQEPPISWHPHHYSVENLSHSHALPSDHTYSGPAITSGRGQPAGGEGGGSGGSDSGRGTAGSGGEPRIPNALDTSLDSATSHKHNNHGHSSGNDSEWVDMTDAELQLIMKKGNDGLKTGGGAVGSNNKLVRRESLAATPPLPPLSPEATPEPSPHPSPPRHRKYSLSYSSSGLNKPDLLEAAGNKRSGGGGGGGGGNGSGSGGGGGGDSQNSSQSTPRRSSGTQPQQHSHTGKSTGGHRSQATLPPPSWHHRKEEERQQRGVPSYDPHKAKNRINIDVALGELDGGEITSTTDALDLDSMLDGATEATTDEDDDNSHPDVHLIRKQLEGLEGMYSEVLKLLGGGGGGGGGGRRGSRHMHVGGGGGDLKTSRRRLHGSLSSLPSSIMSSRPGRDKRNRVIDDRVRKLGRDGGGRTIHKRFQRLESHVVTLARSVAHLSSEMRTQHLMFQEIESVRAEVAALRTGGGSGGGGGGGGSGGGGGGHSGRTGGHVSWESFRAGIPGLSNPGRVKKLTQFFGDEPPLVRIFLRKLGYEKYAALFEQEKIGMLELPYLTEERLQKIGIPMGPRLRILQEAQGPIRKEGNLSVYVV
ncbi:hypothetical protein Pmani_033484 [Petrolisthes manimaculis]|uniref:SAM domain-containing protein n=1 Tax=Petrolisthes manimaculis TaxID=1843537 RepID=A0AAE1NQD5_9EUCA|nr:hypothetical protein Pmani_033484 [Petrolisthes manimaculis]